MIVSSESRFVFVHNPKCGGTAFRDAAEAFHDHPTSFWQIQKSPLLGIELDFAHLRLWEVRTLFPDVFARLTNFRSAVFVRNPMNRLVSALHQHFRHYRSSIEIDEQPVSTRLEIFRQFCQQDLCATSIISDYRYVHFSPQSWFIALGGDRIVRSIIPIDGQSNPIEPLRVALEIDIDMKHWRAEQVGTGHPLLTDPELMAVCQRLYETDFDLFSTIPHLGALASAPC